MKIKLTIIFLTLIQLSCYSQDFFTSRKGSMFFPGHLDIAITIENKNVKYELFNHWYSISYTQLRQFSIPLDSLNDFNLKNDSINIILLKGKLKLIDKKYRINKKIKNTNLCTSVSKMRKISFAYKVSKENGNLGHLALFKMEDLELSEEEFKIKVTENLKAIKKQQPLTAP